jgi:hypothetical protein
VRRETWDERSAFIRVIRGEKVLPRPRFKGPAMRLPTMFLLFLPPNHILHIR